MARFSLTDLDHPIIQAPLAGGPSTPALAAAVGEAGGLGFLAAGYKTVDAVRGDLRDLRARTARPFGVNVFAPPGAAGDAGTLERYAGALRAESERYGVPLGEPRHDDDAFADKVALLAAERPAVASFTFGCPPVAVFDELHEAGVAMW